MKIILVIILTLSAELVKAQCKIWTREEAKTAGFHIDQLPVTYAQAFSEDLSKELFNVLDESLGSVLSLKANPAIGVFVQVLVSDKGSADYVIFDAERSEGYNKDSLNRLIKNSFTTKITDWKMSKKPDNPFHVVLFRVYGRQDVPRQTRQTDSSVVTIENAIAIQDTLKIKRIFFNQLELTELPEVVYRFPNVEELYLSENKLKTLSIDFNRLPRLKQLHLQKNMLAEDGFVLSGNQSLEILNLRENNFTDIPSAARACKKLESLWLGGNKLSALSNRSFRRLKQVKDLNFYKSQLAILPRGIKKMKNLEVLDLYYNQFESLPSSLTKLRKLTHLAISYNQLKTLPKNMDRLKNVHTLYAHHNRLSTLPEKVSKMENISILDLGFNWFTNFPSEVASLKGLQELDISSNNFPDFPAKLLEINKLNKLYLQGNPFAGKDIETKYQQQLSALKDKNIEVFY